MKIDQATIVAGRDRCADTPAQSRNFLDAMRGLFRWAKEAQHVKTDPRFNVKNPKRKKGPGFKMWTEDEMAAYERRWTLGARQRVWLDTLAYAGLRPIPGFAAATSFGLGASTSAMALRPPHLTIRCGPEAGKENEINASFFDWCGREDSNLHGLPR